LPPPEIEGYILSRMNPPSLPQSYLKPDGAAPGEAASGVGRTVGSEDESLVRRMAAGEDQALGVLYDRWYPLVHGVVSRLVRQPDDVEDVVEETFWQAWRQASRFDPARGAVQTWLLTIARSRALDRVRSLRRRREDPLQGDDGEPVIQQAAEGDPGLDAEASERRSIVVAALNELPTEQREALELGYFGGLSQSEIAERTGQPLGTVKTRMRLAMQKLRGQLQILRSEGEGEGGMAR
jgi:RNA polymerase sigma-70 factor (ECF subfamily)